MSEGYRWLFVGDIPILYDKRRVARQMQVQFMFGDNSLIKEKLGLKTPKQIVEEKTRGYIV